MSVLGDVVVRISGAIVGIYAWERELHGHLDQGDLIRERSIGVGSGLLFRIGEATPGSLSNHGLHGVEPIGEHLVEVSDHRRVHSRRSVLCFLIRLRCVSSQRRSWEVRACPGIGCFQSWHRANLSPESTLLVACRVKGLVFVSEGSGTPMKARDWSLLEFNATRLLDFADRRFASGVRLLSG
uniref:Uncharacterized protein n=1 Tax=Brassica oleracea var. oleracea TaxID=109376 RepID=A0A0D3CJ24_BRAOL